MIKKTSKKPIKKETKEKSVIDCKNCKFNGSKCLHPSNKGILVIYRHEQETYFKTPDEININGECENFVVFS